MLSLIGFIAALGPLVVFHELGHFLFAKLFGVKAEAFSVGFGPKLWGRTIGETEWKVSAIPLGGFVKLLGEEPGREVAPEDKHRTLQSKAAWQRFFIFFGGPLFNFVLSVLIFMAIFLIGDEQPASVVGRVQTNSSAYSSGLRSGDRITSVNGVEVKRYQELDRVLSEYPGAAVSVTVVRGAETRNLSVRLGSHEGFSQYGEVRSVGELDGVGPFARSLKVGVSDPQSKAGLLGIKTGDLIKSVALNGTPLAVSNFEALEEAYWAAPVGASIALTFEGANKQSVTLELKKTTGESLAQGTGLYSSEMFVDQVMKGSPAEASGLKPGDRLVSVSGVVPASFLELREQIQKSAEQTGKVTLAWERAGKLEKVDIKPNMSETVDPILRKSKQFTVGVVPMLEFSEGPMDIERILNPFTLVARSVGRMVELSQNNLVSIGKLLRGDVSIGVMGGPISIGKIAGDSLSRGLIAFLTTMAMLSVGLGVLNLLPVPVLDGGHIVLLGIETIRKKPLSIRQLEIVQQVGLSLILLLMVVVIRNDIARLPFFK